MKMPLIADTRPRMASGVASCRMVERNTTDTPSNMPDASSNSADSQKLVDTPKPAEETADLWRFQTAVAAGKTAEFRVKEEKDFGTSVQLTNSPDDQIRYFIRLNETSPGLKAKLTEALGLKGKWDGQRRELAQVVADLQRITADQDRIRKNLRETPKEAPVYETYLKKLSDQEI